jgi:ATP-dependent exoDNAse (exonuclease V) beta subunit
MVIICRHRSQMDACADELHRISLPFQVRYRSGEFNPAADTIKVMTMHVSKGLEFPVVALAGVGDMPADGEDEHEEARLFYVAATRATHKLIVPIAGDRAFGAQLLGGGGLMN